jgi:hypothetical protein
MANPNRAFANIAKRAPVEEINCKSLWDAQCVAEGKRAEGFDAKATQRKYGSRAKPSYAFTCFVYEKATRS